MDPAPNASTLRVASTPTPTLGADLSPTPCPAPVAPPSSTPAAGSASLSGLGQDLDSEEVELLLQELEVQRQMLSANTTGHDVTATQGSSSRETQHQAGAHHMPSALSLTFLCEAAAVLAAAPDVNKLNLPPATIGLVP
ncbi:hypothetical protein HaLaN_24674 [Haematococcus lacustris]|uniref:Uncharacterized protein n=1 Tax=Haematococcus lacustris TaxID=44745 RepID=A0A699ZZ06_HAELA|nr:hypothetical protein HaLaN_24674 [Haematococcus lacustris]